MLKMTWLLTRITNWRGKSNVIWVGNNMLYQKFACTYAYTLIHLHFLFILLLFVANLHVHMLIYLFISISLLCTSELVHYQILMYTLQNKHNLVKEKKWCNRVAIVKLLVVGDIKEIIIRFVPHSPIFKNTSVKC